MSYYKRKQKSKTLSFSQDAKKMAETARKQSALKDGNRALFF